MGSGAPNAVLAVLLGFGIRILGKGCLSEAASLVLWLSVCFFLALGFPFPLVCLEEVVLSEGALGYGLLAAEAWAAALIGWAAEA